jgi:hypothetical protein
MMLGDEGHHNLCVKYISRLKLIYICYVLRQINCERQPQYRIIRERFSLGLFLVGERLGCNWGLGSLRESWCHYCNLPIFLVKLSPCRRRWM